MRLFRDFFRLDTLMDLEEQGGRGVILKVPSATLELFDVRHTDVVDGIEAGRPTGQRVRIAVRIDDLGQAALEVAGAGAEPLAEPVLTPWGDHNQRFRLAGGSSSRCSSPRVGETARPEPSRHGLGVDDARGRLVYWLPASIRRRFRLARGRVGRARKRGSPGACRRRTRSRSKGR